MHAFVSRCFYHTFRLERVWVIKQCSDSLQNLESLNLNGCQKISDRGVEAITSICPNLKVFSIYWNVRYFKLIYLCISAVVYKFQETELTSLGMQIEFQGYRYWYRAFGEQLQAYS